jgi:hypothetical protein
MALVERDADPIFFTPNDVAGPLDLIACYKKREAVRNEQRGDYFERSTGSEMFRTVQSIPPPPNSIVPAFNMRRRGAIRCSSMGSYTQGVG